MPTPVWVKNIRKFIGHEPIMVTGVNAVVLNDVGHVLLQKRSDDGSWGLPGGILELGESLLDAVKREAKEETGIEIRVGRLTGIYVQPVHAYPNGDQVSTVVAVFGCDYVSGELVCEDGEATEIKYFSPEDLPEGLHPKFLPRIHDALMNGEPVVR